MASSKKSRRWMLRDLPRVYVVFGCAAFAAAFIICFIDWSPKAQQTAAAKPKPAIANSGDDEKLYTGTILVPTIRYDQCWQFMFDNRTGYFQDEGYVSCAKAALKLPEQDSPAGVETTRLREVGKAFRNQGK